MTTSPRTSATSPLQHLRRRRFGQLLPLGGIALLAACSKTPEPAAPAAPASPDPVPATPAPTTGTGTAATGGSNASLPMVDPADPSAVALVYTADATQVDAARQPKYQPGQACANCALYAGAAGSDAGPCPLFAGRQVSAKAWCTTYAKKA